MTFRPVVIPIPISLALLLSSCSSAVPIDGGDADTHPADAGTGGDAGGDAGSLPDAHPLEPPCEDADGDGHPSPTCGGDDCDDLDPTVYPGAPDRCGDGIDTNCDGLDPAGGLLGEPLLVFEHPPVSGSLYTAMLWTGREYLFFRRIWDGDGVYMQRIDGSGALDGAEVRLRSFEAAFDVAWNGSRLGAAWSRVEGEVGTIWFQPFDRHGRPLATATALDSSSGIPWDGSVSYGPRIVAAGDEFFVVWNDEDDSGRNVYLARLGPDGAMRNGPTLVGTSRGGDSAKLALATSGSGLLVGWTSDRGYTASELYLRAFTLDPSPIAEARLASPSISLQRIAQLAWTGSEYVALWSEADHGDDDGPVMVSRRDATGAEIGTVALSSPVTGEYRYLRPAAWTGDRLAVLWSRVDGEDHELTLTRFESDGTAYGETITAPAASWPGSLALAWTGGELGFTWAEADRLGSGYRAWFQRASFCD